MRLETTPLTNSETLQDSVIASSLITAPAWGLWLSEVNGVLTTVTLLIGIAIGLHRLWKIVQRPKDSNGPGAEPGSIE